MRMLSFKVSECKQVEVSHVGGCCEADEMALMRESE